MEASDSVSVQRPQSPHAYTPFLGQVSVEAVLPSSLAEEAAGSLQVEVDTVTSVNVPEGTPPSTPSLPSCVGDSRPPSLAVIRLGQPPLPSAAVSSLLSRCVCPSSPSHVLPSGLDLQAFPRISDLNCSLLQEQLDGQ